MRKATCICHNCNNEGTKKVELFRRGNRNAYMCEEHYRRLQGYSIENGLWTGTTKKNNITCSLELETSYTNEKARIELFANDYIATSDCTVDVEYKSPIMKGLNKVSKQCETIQKLIDTNCLEINHTCGTHFHVGNIESINPMTMDFVARFYHSLFIPLCETMKANPEKTEQLFGRGFGHWCRTIDSNTYARQHENFINLQHDYTIEFRMCKFVNAKQYMHCIKFCVDVTDCIIKNFINHFDDENIDTRRYSNKTEYRKHKAQVTANKLVKLFEKYTSEF